MLKIRMKIKNKVLLPTIFVIVVSYVVLGAMFYNQMKDNLIESGMEQASSGAQTALKKINTVQLSIIKEGDDGSYMYRSILDDLVETKESSNLAYIYTLYTDGNEVYYGIDSDSENPHKVGDVFEVSYKELEGVFNGTPYIQDYIDNTDSGDLITAYYPIESEGKVIGILGSDFDASGIQSKLNQSIISIGYITVGCIFVTILLLSAVISAILKNLTLINNKVYDLVSNEGDLTQKIELHSGDEIEDISENINKLLDYIRDIMNNINVNSSNLMASSNLIADDIEISKKNIYNISLNMEDISATMEETSASLNQIGEVVIKANDSIESISINADKGKNTSNRIVNISMETHKNALNDRAYTKEKVTELSETVAKNIEHSKSVEKIGSLTAEILKITSQTKLLSLNASIEAARAGEAGRGFAVVAEEIGKLAANSAQAANEIKSVSEEVVQTVEELAYESEKLLKFVETATMAGYDKLLEVCTEHSQNVETMTGMMNDFSDASNKLKDDIENIKEVIFVVTTAIEENTIGITNIADTSSELSLSMQNINDQALANTGVANQLSLEVNKFKI